LAEAAIMPAGEKTGRGWHKSPDDDLLRLVSFSLNGGEYAFEISGAFEVIKPREVTEVPCVPDFIKGILSVRGEMLPIMDLKLRLGMDASGNDYMMKRILVAGGEECKAGFMVDGIGAIKEFKANRFKQAKHNAGFLMGTVSVKGETINILDIDKLLKI
jgi:purine-binding chemotaxis protein CheW